MKTLNILLIILIAGFISCKNNETYVPFKPADLEYIKSISYKYLLIRTTHDTINKFQSIWEPTFYEAEYDSLLELCDKFHDDSCETKIINRSIRENIFGIQKRSILRIDTLGSIKAIVYENRNYDHDNEGYWIALSENNGKSWNKYYTGLTKGSFYYFKQKSTIPLFVSDSIIQIESSLIRMIKPYLFPTSLPEYELLQDGLIISINLNLLKLDSDKDGLTDIEEKKFVTDPFNQDSDV